MGQPRNYSDETAATIDSEVKRIVREQLERGRQLLTDNREKLEGIAKALLEKESINADELNAIVSPAAAGTTPASSSSDSGTGDGDHQPDSDTPGANGDGSPEPAPA